MNKASKFVAVILLVAFILGLFVFYRRHRGTVEAEVEQQAQRDAQYAAVLSGYQQALPPGTTRLQVGSYLSAQKVSYFPTGDGTSWETLIGQEPDYGIACDRWNVYIVFDFDTSQRNDTALTDALRGIRIQKIGHCL